MEGDIQQIIKLKEKNILMPCVQSFTCQTTNQQFVRATPLLLKFVFPPLRSACVRGWRRGNQPQEWKSIQLCSFRCWENSRILWETSKSEVGTLSNPPSLPSCPSPWLWCFKIQQNFHHQPNSLTVVVLFPIPELTTSNCFKIFLLRYIVFLWDHVQEMNQDY